MADTEALQAQSTGGTVPEQSPLTYEQSADRLAKLSGAVIGTMNAHQFFNVKKELAHIEFRPPSIDILLPDDIFSGEKKASVNGVEGFYTGIMEKDKAAALYVKLRQEHNNLNFPLEESA